MIRLISLLPRAPHLTHEEFLTYWRDTHGPLVARNAAARFVQRYEQHAVAWPADAGPDKPRHEPPFDGVTIQEFDSVADFWAHNAEPDAALIMEDTKNFLAMEKLQWVLTEEPVMVIDRT
jgi:uncharacterized protein (TIGR02118 family)